MECPDCCLEQSFSLGAARCKACGFTMTIDLEEPRCACGFLLYRLEGDRCPECGLAVRPTVVSAESSEQNDARNDVTAS